MKPTERDLRVEDAALVADARRRIDLSMFGDNWGRADRILICATIRRLLALADEAIRLREEVEKLRAKVAGLRRHAEPEMPRAGDEWTPAQIAKGLRDATENKNQVVVVKSAAVQIAKWLESLPEPASPEIDAETERFVRIGKLFLELWEAGAPWPVRHWTCDKHKVKGCLRCKTTTAP